MIERSFRHLAFFAPAAVMAGWGTVMLHTVANGHINRLLNPLFRSYVLVAGLLLVLLSAAYVLLYQPAADPALTPKGRGRDVLRWLVLLIPVVAASIFSPAALSATTMSNRSNPSSTAGVTAMPSMSAATAQNVKEALAADPNQPVPVDVTDLITLAKSPEQMKAFEGRKVHAVGFIIRSGPGTPKLLRWLMWCCAADAQPVSVKLTGDLNGTFKDDQWFELVGTVQFPSTLGQVTPTIAVDSIKPTTEPDEPYLSP